MCRLEHGSSGWGARMIRMWINQPSTLQAHHGLHGQNVLATREGDVWRVYFLSGDVISMQLPINALSKGWK